MDEHEERQARLNALRQALAGTDYKAAKYAEGWYTDEEYAPIKAQRQAWRDEINRLEAENETALGAVF